jgi:hypothetical protein
MGRTHCHVEVILAAWRQDSCAGKVLMVASEVKDAVEEMKRQGYVSKLKHNAALVAACPKRLSATRANFAFVHARSPSSKTI